MNAQEYAKEWLASVSQDMALYQESFSLQDHLADAFVGGLPMNTSENQRVLEELRQMNPTQLLSHGEWGRAFYMNIFVPEEWYLEHEREMTWEEFVVSQFNPNRLN